MNNTYKHTAYKSASHMVSKTKQVIMLYEGAIRFAQQAKTAMSNNNIQDRYNSLVKSCDIINGLQTCIDFDNGGEISQILYDFYAGIDMRLMSLHHDPRQDIIDLCINQLKLMKSAWEDIDAQASDIVSSGANAQNPSANKDGDEIDMSNPNIAASINAAMSSLSITA